MAPEFSLPSGMGRDRFEAMGTRISVLLPLGWAETGFPSVRALFAEWDQRLTRFRNDSELSYVNAHAGEPVTVSPLLWQVLMAALEAARATSGTFDPTLLRQLVAAGYDRTFSRLPADAPPTTHTVAPGGAWRWIRLDARTHTVTLPPGAALDFGGIAKGMAVDAALEALIAMGVPQAAVEAGGDLRVHGRPTNAEGWQVAVDLPEGSELVTLYRGALATSSVARRRWKQGGVERHHLLDPRTGRPAENGLWSVTVAAPLCRQADVAAKTAFLLGRERGTSFLVGHGLAGLMVTRDGNQQRVGRWLGQPQEVSA